MIKAAWKKAVDPEQQGVEAGEKGRKQDFQCLPEQR